MYNKNKSCTVLHFLLSIQISSQIFQMLVIGVSRKFNINFSFANSFSQWFVTSPKKHFDIKLLKVFKPSNITWYLSRVSIFCTPILLTTNLEMINRKIFFPKHRDLVHDLFLTLQRCYIWSETGNPFESWLNKNFIRDHIIWII